MHALEEELGPDDAVHRLRRRVANGTRRIAAAGLTRRAALEAFGARAIVHLSAQVIHLSDVTSRTAL